jgi:hypothetical protein
MEVVELCFITLLFNDSLSGLCSISERMLYEYGAVG